MALEIISAKTAAETSTGIRIDGNALPATIIVIGLTSGEEVGVEISNDGGTTWEQVRIGNSDFKIDYDTAHSRVIQARCLIRFVKGVTINPVSIGLSVKDNV